MLQISTVGGNAELLHSVFEPVLNAFNIIFVPDEMNLFCTMAPRIYSRADIIIAERLIPDFNTLRQNISFKPENRDIVFIEGLLTDFTVLQISTVGGNAELLHSVFEPVLNAFNIIFVPDEMNLFCTMAPRIYSRADIIIAERLIPDMKMRIVTLSGTEVVVSGL